MVGFNKIAISPALEIDKMSALPKSRGLDSALSSRVEKMRASSPFHHAPYSTVFPSGAKRA